MSLPPTIGRYHVVGHLASGGMAEILLAKVFGPAGFEQAVVLKRILPHLMRQESFASMFVDEALIIARINHPNVVRVHELGQDEGELYLVMEYLEGENLHGVMRRLAAREERLDWSLCTHVLAEACAGLHAAHEVRDPDGNLQNLVHRDVSPQNVFLTYGGEVKLLDFGIAKAADRITRTEAGQIKGKYAYMSPEQIKGKRLDRRSDLFSLGTVLYEVSTERRLFQRASEMLTMQAISERPIRPPSSFIDGYPKELEEVVMRALARDPDERYQTAAEMRHDLLSAQQAIGGHLAPEETLGDRMHGLFPDRIAEKRELLRRIRSGSSVTHVPSAEVDLDVEIPSIVHEIEEEPTAATVPEIPAPRARTPWRAAAIGLLVLAGLGVGGILYATSERADVRQVQQPGSASRARRGPVPEGEAETRAPSGGERTGSDAPERDDARRTVELRVETIPPGAAVWFDGRARGPSPVTLELRRGDVPVVVEARRRGFRSAARRFVPEEDGELVLRLRRRTTPDRDDAAEDEPPDTPRIKRFH